jgi:RND superfamily putative drug exporter
MERTSVHSRSSQHGVLSRTPLQRWGARIVRSPRPFLVAPLLLVLALLPAALQVSDNLSTVGWTPDSADSQAVQRLMEEQFGRATINHYILFSDPTGAMHADDRAFRLAVEQAVRPFRIDPDVAAVYTWGSTRSEDLNTALISDDRRMSIAVIVMEHTTAPSEEQMRSLTSHLHSDVLEIRIGGWPATAQAFLDLARDDLTRAEIIALPITLVLLLVIFGGVIAAGVPIVLAILSMVATLAILSLLSRVMMVNVFSINAVTMLGLAVGIDYALIMVSRFREESAATPMAEAIPRVLDTAGRAVLVAGSTVAIGLGGLVLFGLPAAISTGLAGASVVLACVALSLTVLPATFVLWGDRIGRGRAGSRWRIPAPHWAAQVRALPLRYPLAVVLVTGAVLLSLAAPLRHIIPSSPTMTILPRENEARVVYDTIAQHFPQTTLSPVIIVVEPAEGSMLAASNLALLRDLTRTLREQEHVTAVDSVWGYIPLGVTPDAFATSLLLEPDLIAATAPLVNPAAALVNVTPDAGLDASGRRQLISDLRAAMPALAGERLTVRIGGDAALDLDLTTRVRERIPLVVAFVIGLTWVALFAQFRSVFLPFKAILLNLCSLSASFGALVWIFQDGHLSGLLGFEPTGYTVILIPILMFCFLFGLSMDFEVLMLSRIREAWEETGENGQAIGIGLRRSAGIVTSSAAVLLVVFLAFGASELQVIKSLGVGLAIAVFIDATIIRLLLLPATMQLMGRWNWWLPGQSPADQRGPASPQTRAESV